MLKHPIMAMSDRHRQSHFEHRVLIQLFEVRGDGAEGAVSSPGCGCHADNKSNSTKQRRQR